MSLKNKLGAYAFLPSFHGLSPSKVTQEMRIVGTIKKVTQNPPE